jgi:hypothetical protein
MYKHTFMHQLQASSPDEEALVEGAAMLGYRLLNRTTESVAVEWEGREWVYDVLAVLEFNSDRFVCGGVAGPESEWLDRWPVATVFECWIPAVCAEIHCAQTQPHDPTKPPPIPHAGSACPLSRASGGTAPSSSSQRAQTR